ncbi:type IV pilus modification protein PilV [Rheinheimera sp. MMS21-TC3]|uniref:type IV pilus modification protein PilV n=1 Tax=Rheinheimera sp. MMS21-TC3 TaxID=3072790 RepID=UPI0028C414F1|nr:type IV pilus modification protein PilV [Rheinheimera sp. MMS21-TC3]WNO59994.1 type IV pilus modification protein PilV [Rheinheimera sp. MMS21-TC3]
MKTTNKFTKQQGTSLLEVLIAVLVLAVGILGIAGLQSVSLRSTNTAHERAMAVILTETLFEVMRTNPDLARAGGFEMTTCAGAAGIAATTAWQEDVKQATSECAVVEWNDGVYTVTIDWADQRLNSNSVVVMEVRP